MGHSEDSGRVLMTYVSYSVSSLKGCSIGDYVGFVSGIRGVWTIAQVKALHFLLWGWVSSVGHIFKLGYYHPQYRVR